MIRIKNSILVAALHELDEIRKEDISVSVTKSRNAVVDDAGVVVHRETLFPLLVVLMRAIGSAQFLQKPQKRIL